MKDLQKKNSVVQFRVLDIYSSIAASSPEKFELCKQHGFLNDLINLIHINDVLSQLNAIEILQKLLNLREGSAFLQASSCLSYFQKLLGSEDPFVTQLLVPKIIGFFGEMSLKGTFELQLIESNQIFPIIQKVFQNDSKEALVNLLNKISALILNENFLFKFLSLQQFLFVENWVLLWMGLVY